MGARGRVAVGAAAVAMWTGWGIVGSTGGAASLALTAVGFLLLSCLAGMCVAGVRGAVGLLLGSAAGCAACSAGLPGSVDVAVVMAVCSALAALGGLLSGRAEASPERGDSGVGWAPAAALSAACGAAAVGLLRGYLPVSRCAAYGVTDLGLAVFLGMATFFLIVRDRWVSRAIAVGCTAVALLCLVASFSFLGYPDLILSESAALQTASRLLVGGRTFPFWGLAFVLGLATAPAWATGGKRYGLALVALSAAAGASLAGALGWAYRAPCVVSIGLAFCALMVVWAPGFGRRQAPGSMVRPAVLLVVVLALLYSVLGDPHRGWIGLRRSAAYGGSGSEAVEVVEARTSAEGLWATTRSRDVTTTFWNGDVSLMARGQEPLGGIPIPLAYALGVAAADGPRSIGVIGSTPAEICWAGRILPPAAQVSAVEVGHGCPGGPFDLVACGPSALSGGSYPLKLLSTQGMRQIRQCLAPDGVMALWFPAGWVDLDVLARSVATVGSVFAEYNVFLSGRDAVIIAGAHVRPSYGGLKTLFQDRGTASSLASIGVWEPEDLLVGYSASHVDLDYLARGVGPYTLRRPCRPPLLARDLSAPMRTAALAVLLQHRLGGSAKLRRAMAFGSEVERAVALHGFREVYDERTTQMLRELGRCDQAGRRELIEFLYGPMARMDLLAPGQEDRTVQVANALSRFELRQAAAAVLEQTIAGGRDDFAMQFHLAEVLERLEKPVEALLHYRQALAHDPDSVVTMRKIAAMQIVLARYDDAVAMLEKVVEREPDSISALLMLGNLCAGKLNRFRDAASAALRVLEVDPDNTPALDLLALCRQAMKEQQ